ncbi:unnamed protein product [Lampetra planeri]
MRKYKKPEAACGGRGAVARPLDSPTARLRAGPSSPAGSSVLGSPHLSWFDPCRSANAFGRQQQQQKEQDLMCCREPAPLLR